MFKRMAAVTVMIIFAFVLVQTAYSHMMGTADQKEGSSKADIHSNCGMMTKMNEMPEGCMMRGENFGKLKEHFQGMMEIDDMDALKTKMNEHYAMMNDMSEQYSGHCPGYENMSSMMESCPMYDMMHGTSGEQGEEGANQPHNH